MKNENLTSNMATLGSTKMLLALLGLLAATRSASALPIFNFGFPDSQPYES
jgi:hypothetical protein